MEITVNTVRIVSVLIMVLALAGCALNGQQSAADQRSATLAMKNKVLTELFQIKPDVKAQISKASGYAVFSNANVNLILASVGGGYGVVKNNASGRYTFMKMGEIGVGIGLGVKDFRLVFVFHSQQSMDRFVDQGWAFGVQADAAAKANNKGAAVGGEATIDNITIYQLTETGLALQATVKGTKYWQDEQLN
jgi:lipid-binding SYLF domain-containing protein